MKLAQPFPAPELRASPMYGHEDFSDSILDGFS